MPNNVLNPSGQLGLPELYSGRFGQFKEEIEFNFSLHKENINNNIRIGFFFRSMMQNDLLVDTPLNLILLEDGEKTKEIPIKHDYGYSFKFYEISLTKTDSKQVKLIIQFEAIETAVVWRRNYHLAGPFLFIGDIWQDTTN